MDKVRSVVVYGGSLSMMALEAALKDSPGFRVVRLDVGQPDFVQALQALQPDVIIGNVAAINPHVSSHCLQLALHGEKIVLIKHDAHDFSGVDEAQQQLSLVRTVEELIEFLWRYTV
jgi:hypothetical protein